MARSRPRRWPAPRFNRSASIRSRALYWAAVVNGVLAAPLMALMMLIVRNPRAMGRLTLSGRSAIWGWAATLVMAGATAIFFLFLMIG